MLHITSEKYSGIGKPNGRLVITQMLLVITMIVGQTSTVLGTAGRCCVARQQVRGQPGHLVKGPVTDDTHQSQVAQHTAVEPT